MRPAAALLAAFFAVACSAGREKPDAGSVDAGTDGGGPIFTHTIYTNSIPDGGTGLATGEYNRPSVRYGSIPVDAKFNRAISFMMTPMLPPRLAALPSNGPLILYTDDLETIVFSPMDHFYAALISFEDGEIRYGVEGEVDTIPPGFRHRFIMVRGNGVNATIERWGELLRTDRGMLPRDRYADKGLSYLGYWTDNGAYYYYRTEDGKNEQDTMLAVVADAEARGIPLGYLQLDSWWYFKEPGTPPGGLILWEPIPAMFPQGLASFSSKLGLPLVAHNRWFAINNGYRAKYEFADAEKMALPLSRGVFDEFMLNAKAWGIQTYEQDWLMPQYLGIPQLRNSINAPEKWFSDMTGAVADQGLTMQICMAGASHLMDSVDKPSVTSIRTSIDYQPGVSKESFWPQFHTVNMIAFAVGILPFKDNFRSAGLETRPEPEALISILSAGMVGPSDKVGEMDRGILLRTCRDDGLLLKPDRPALPLDAMFLPNQRPYTVSTVSRRPEGTWTYLAAFLLASGHPERRPADEAFAAFAYDGISVGEMFIFPKKVTDWKADLGTELGLNGRLVAYDWRAGTASVVEGTLQITPIGHLYDYAYFVLAPVFANGLALIGEPAKYITMADRRFVEVMPGTDSISVKLAGVPGEEVTLLVYDTKSGMLLPTVPAVIGQDGTAEANLKK
jgi:hypothetical protein